MREDPLNMEKYAEAARAARARGSGGAMMEYESMGGKCPMWSMTDFDLPRLVAEGEETR